MTAADRSRDARVEGSSLRWAFISWGRLSRADTIAAHLGIPSHTIRYFYRGYRGTSAPVTVLKYALQALRTLFVCVRDRPRVVIVTNPPLFAVVPVHLYAVVFRARYVIDFHSGCFIQEHWRRWDRWQRFFSRRAALNLAHNAENAEILQRWGAPWEILPSLPPDLGVGAVAPSGAPPGAAASAGDPGAAPSPSGPARLRCVYICSFKEDEPVDAVIEAARGLPYVDVLVTGRAPEGLRSRIPPNVTLTGFLDEAPYLSLLAGADLIVALTTRQGTLLYGAQEAIALHKPLILSATETLRSAFLGGALFAENTAEGLRAAMESALARREDLSARMATFHAEWLAAGRARLGRVVERLGECAAPSAPSQDA